MRILPILFNTDMVRALLDNRKTVTRRVVKLKYSNTHLKMFTNKYGTRLVEAQNEEPGVTAIKNPDGTTTHRLLAYIEKTPPYRPGDVLYVREKWRLIDFDFIDGDWSASVQYGADEGIGPRFHYLPDGPDTKLGWRPSIHMPREAARIFLRVTDVRVERLQDITVEDVLREGVDVELPPICKQAIDQSFPTDEQRAAWERMNEAQRDEYVETRARHIYIGWLDYADRLFLRMKNVWGSTLKPTDRVLYGWEADPWAWVISFERCEKPKGD